MERKKREKKPLEGYVVADVIEYFRPKEYSPLNHIIKITAVIQDPRCSVKRVGIGFSRSVYRFTKTTKVVSPLYIQITVYSKSYKKRNLIRDINGLEFTRIYDSLSYLRYNNERVFALEISSNVIEDEFLYNVIYEKSYRLKIKASDIKDRGSVLRYLFKTTDEKLSRNFVS